MAKRHTQIRTSYERRAGYYRLLSESTLCIYCGMPKQCLDHFLPVSKAAEFHFTERHKVLVPACNECNAIASDRIFKSLGEKRHWIKQKLYWKYLAIINGSSWTKEQLEELGPTLRRKIEWLVGKKTQVLERLAYVPDAIKPSHRNERGRGSVVKLVEVATTPTSSRPCEQNLKQSAESEQRKITQKKVKEIKARGYFLSRIEFEKLLEEL